MANNPYCYELAFVRPKRISVAATRQYFSGTVASVTRTRQNQKYEQKVNPAQGTVRGEARPGCAKPSVRGYPQQIEREIQHRNQELRCCAVVLPSRGRQCRPSQLMDSAKRGQPAQPVYGNQRINKTMSNDSNQEWGYEQRTACSGQSRQCCDRNEFLRHARNGGQSLFIQSKVSGHGCSIDRSDGCGGEIDHSVCHGVNAIGGIHSIVAQHHFIDIVIDGCCRSSHGESNPLPETHDKETHAHPHRSDGGSDPDNGNPRGKR